MSKHKRSAERRCEYCGKIFMAYANGKTTARFCSRSCATLSWSPEVKEKVAESHRKPLVQVTCQQCGKIFMVPPTGQTSANRKFCSSRCCAIYRFKNTDLGKAYAAKMREAGNGWEGTKRPDVAERMTRSNPMRNPEIINKVCQSLNGRTFLSRGGNGTTTKPQEQLRQALGLPQSSMEFGILTANAKPYFPSLPPVYKVDLAIQEVKLAIEIDGRTHKTKKWRFLDERKTEVLNFCNCSGQ